MLDIQVNGLLKYISKINETGLCFLLWHKRAATYGGYYFGVLIPSQKL
jgi:hypothetical protein